MERHTAKVIYMDSGELPANKDYEVQLDHHFGISKDSCGSEHITMSFVRQKPGNRSRAHYHINSELAQYFIKGTGRYIVGVGTEDEQEFALRPGTFIYIPRGVIHVIENTGDCDLESVAAYSCNSGDATGKFFSEMPLPPKE